MAPSFAVIVLIGVLAVGIMAYFSWQAAKKRRLMLQAFAKRRGFSFHPDRDRGIDNEYRHFDCFRLGSNRYGYNIMRGEHDGRRVRCFDFHYETTSTDSEGKRKTHHHHSTNVIFNAGRQLGELLIRPEGFFDKLSGAFGFDDIDFESAEFSRKFLVKAPDRRWAFDVISQEVMELLLKTDRFRIEMAGRLMLLRRERHFRLPDYDAALGVGAKILNGIPADAGVTS